MKKIVFITPEDANLGFRLSGATDLPVREGEVEETLARLTGEPDVGLVAIDERLLGGMDEKRLREMERAWHGLIVVLPAPEAPGPEEEDYALALIRRAVGYHVRVRP